MRYRFNLEYKELNSEGHLQTTSSSNFLKFDPLLLKKRRRVLLKYSFLL